MAYANGYQGCVTSLVAVVNVLISECYLNDIFNGWLSRFIPV